MKFSIMNHKYSNLILNTFRRLICVPKCSSCDERLIPFANGDELDHGYPVLCDKCMGKWQAACSQMCHTCSSVAAKCSCMPRKKTFTQPNIPSLFFYHPDTEKTESKVIYSLKHKRNKDLFEFISEELSPKIRELVEELEIDCRECIMTYIPRTKRALIENGFDQGELLCRSTAERLGIPYANLFVREGGVEQKKLSRIARKKNADRAIFANTELKRVKGFDYAQNIVELIEDKTVIIIEDVITTGATVERAIKCLKSLGARSVLVCAVARSEISTDNKKRSEKES